VARPRIAAVAGIRAGAIAIALALSLAGALAAAGPAAAAKRIVPKGFYGVNVDRDIPWAPAELAGRSWTAMATGGVESARVLFDWSEAQSQRGGPVSFHETDPMVARAAAHGVELLPVVMYAPAWARVKPELKESAPADPAAYAEYLRTLIARYGPNGSFWAEHPELKRRPIRAWQVWNEPHMHWQWFPNEDWDRRYGALLRVAAAAIRAADPKAKVVLAGLTNYSWDRLDDLYRRGRIRGWFDALALNAYTQVPAHLKAIIRRNRGVMDERGDRKVPIWLTEFGASASRGKLWVEGQDHLQTTDGGLAKLVTRLYEMLVGRRRELRVERTYWYTWASVYRDTGAGANGGIFDYSGLQVYDGSRLESKPAYGAYRRSARLHQGCKKDARATCFSSGR
jgi:hypothetical protein